VLQHFAAVALALDMDLTRDQVDMLVGATVIEFGTDWCGYCQAARPLIDDVLAEHPDVRHLRVEDGRAKRLGRTFGVKLWPTFVFLRDGSEVARVVRPRGIDELRDAMAKVATLDSSEMAASR
jgi:thioredoxin 1